MTLRLLEIFLAVCRTLSMTRAAEMLGMTQPAVSRAIYDLECYYGTALFERIGRKLYLTEAGNTLREHASSILSELEDVKDTLREDTMPSICRIGATLMAADILLKDLCLYLYQEIPEVQLNMSVYNASTIEDMLRHNECDLALTDRIDDPVFAYEPLMKQTLSFYVSNQRYPYDTITIDALKKQQLILRENGSGSSMAIMPFLKETGFPITAIWHCSENELLHSLAMAGLGFSFLPDAYVKKHEKTNLHRVAIENKQFERAIYLVRLNQKYLTRNLRTCAEKIKSFCRMHA